MTGGRTVWHGMMRKLTCRPSKDPPRRWQDLRVSPWRPGMAFASADVPSASMSALCNVRSPTCPNTGCERGAASEDKSRTANVQSRVNMPLDAQSPFSLNPKLPEANGTYSYSCRWRNPACLIMLGMKSNVTWAQPAAG